MSFVYKIEAYKDISEDMIEVFSNKDQNIYILCDGAGGFGGGYNAAKTCIYLLKEKLLSQTITETSLITDIRTTCFSLLSILMPK